MKQFVALMLALLLTLSLVACESKESSDDNSSDGKDNTSSPSITFEEKIVADRDNYLIKVTDIIPDGDWGYSLQVELQNKTADKTYTFLLDNTAVNGVEMTPFFSGKVEPKGTLITEISFADQELLDTIAPLTDIELVFYVRDADNPLNNTELLDPVHIYPCGEEKAAAYLRATQDTDQILLDNEQVTVIVTGYDPSSPSGYDVDLYIVNKTEHTLTVTADDATINGKVIDPIFVEKVAPGKSEFSSMSWYGPSLEAEGIATVEEIIFVLDIYYTGEDLSHNVIFNESITLNP